MKKEECMSNDEMTTEREARILEKAVNTYGAQAQIDMMIEEMSELTKALCKYRREQTDSTFEDVLEEMADVQIMLNQMALIFSDFNEQEIAKLERLEMRLDKKASEVSPDWDNALERLRIFEAEYKQLPIRIGIYGLFNIADLMCRYKRGERTQALYDEIMKVE